MTTAYGAVVSILQADSAVAAIVGARVGPNTVSTPCVQLVDNAETRRPYGPGSASVGMSYWQGFAKCFAPDTPAGKAQARALAGAVSNALHGIKATVGTCYIARAWASDIEGLDRDPDKKWPLYTVRIELHAAYA